MRPHDPPGLLQLRQPAPDRGRADPEFTRQIFDALHAVGHRIKQLLMAHRNPLHAHFDHLDGVNMTETRSKDKSSAG
ncbi:hypothetical protein GCM10027440_54270 [Nocardiopsis coralliicola]